MSRYRDLMIDVEDHIINNPEMTDQEIAEVYNVHPSFVAQIRSEIPASEFYDDSMDGDEASALASVGWGTDEDYGYYGDDE